MSVWGCKITNVINNDYLMKGVMSVATIEITWTAYGTMGADKENYKQHLASKGYELRQDASATIELELGEQTDLELCERIYANTNLYQGVIWDTLQAVIPADRPHTALSVGDLVSIDGRKYVCADIGFSLVA